MSEVSEVIDVELAKRYIALSALVATCILISMFAFFYQITKQNVHNPEVTPVNSKLESEDPHPPPSYPSAVLEKGGYV
jgi:hypothetical protein